MVDRPQPRSVHHHRLPGSHFSHEGGADVVQRAGLRGDHPAAVQLPDAQRPHAQRVPYAEQRVLRHQHERVRAPEPAHGVGEAVGPRLNGGVRDQVRHDLGVAGGREVAAPIGQLFLELDGVDDVAVVRQRKLERWAVGQNGLGVRQIAAAGGRVACVTDSDVAGQAGEVVLVEGLRHQAHRSTGPDVLPVAGRYPDALLPPMLKGGQAEECSAGYVFAGRIDAHDPASLLHVVVQKRHSASLSGSWAVRPA